MSKVQDDIKVFVTHAERLGDLGPVGSTFHRMHMQEVKTIEERAVQSADLADAYIIGFRKLLVHQNPQVRWRSAVAIGRLMQQYPTSQEIAPTTKALISCVKDQVHFE